MFSADISRFRTKTSARIDRIPVVVALEIHTRVSARMPVDTGRARGNLNLAGGQADLTNDYPNDPGGSQSLGRAASATRNITPGETISVSLNVPYALPLENGHSKQAPSGMFAVTVAEFQGIVAGAVTSTRGNS